MRTFEEINVDIEEAIRINDTNALRVLATDLQALATAEAEACAISTLGTAARLTGDYPVALEHYTLALQLYEELGNLSGIANNNVNIGSVNWETGDYLAALEYFQRALEILEHTGDRAGTARVNSGIGGVCLYTGDYPAALEHYRRALMLLEDLDDYVFMARVTGNIGSVYLYTGDYPAALEHYRRALALHIELGDRIGEARATGNIGTVYMHIGDYPAALEHYRRALTLHEELGNRPGVATVTGNMGAVYAKTGDYSAALEQHQRALILLEELGNRAGVASCTGNIIQALISLDRHAEAAELLELQASMLMDDPSIRCAHIEFRSELSEHQGDLDGAQRQLREALSIANEAGLLAEEVRYHLDLRDLAQRRSDFAGYIEHNNEYIRISEEIRGQEATQRLTMLEADRRLEAERRERERVRALLFGALPRSVADRMIRGEAVNGDHFPDAAVLFADVAGFTSGSSSLDASQLVTLLEGVFETFDRICDEQAMIKVKTIGDSYMCFKGDATPEENAAALARAALAVRSTGFTWPDGSPLRFRIGLHCGPVTAGVIGTQRLQYDVWGDTVNVASRMESSGEGGRIHVSETFAQLLAGADTATIQHSLIPRGEVEVKGKGTMRTYWLEGA